MIEILVTVLLTMFLLNHLFGTSFYVITKVIYVVFSSTLIGLLFIILKEYGKSSVWIQSHFKSLLFVFSLMIATLTGVLHIGYLKAFVVPDLLYCTYYDEYHYDLYTYETGCGDLKIKEKITDENGDLTKLVYQVKNKEFKRLYDGERVTQTIEITKDLKVDITDSNIPLILDEQIITTDYEYDRKYFKQVRVIESYIDGELLMKQTGSYHAYYEDLKPDLPSVHHIKIDKGLSKVTFNGDKEQLLSTIFTLDYFTQYPIEKEINQDIFVTKLLNHFNQPEVNDSFVLSVEQYDIQNIVFLLDNDDIIHLYNYKDELVDAWSKTDSYFSIQETRENQVSKQITLSYHKQINNGHDFDIQENQVTSYLTVECNDDFTYCDGVMAAYNQPTVLRYLVHEENQITKVEAYNIIGKDYFNRDRKHAINDDYMTYKTYQADFYPFDYELSTLEFFEEPNDFMRIR